MNIIWWTCCQIIDAEQYSWDKEGVLKAVNALFVERNTLFDNMIKKLDDYPELKRTLKGILFSGKTRSYNPDEKYIQIATMFNYIVNKEGKIAVACRIMEMVIDYLGKQYVIELKIWRGNAYNERGEDQLCRYLEYLDLKEGYLLSFCFNKTKQSGLLPPVELNGRTLIEAIV